jgi:glycerol kinase
LPNHLIAIDQGTTSTRAIVFDADLKPRAVAQRELKQIYPKPGWVEHDPEEIWQATIATVREAMAAAKLTSRILPVSASPISARPASSGTA